MRAFFTPATWLMKRLTYPQKFGLLSLVFAIPLTFLLSAQLTEIQRQINFTRSELTGTTYLQPLREILQDIIEQQLIAEQYLGGDQAFLTPLLLKNEELAQHLETFKAFDLQYQDRYDTQTQVTILFNEWERLQAQLTLRSVPDSNAAHDRLIQAVRACMQRIGDQSGLILDPNIDSYYLMNALIETLPAHQAATARVAGAGGNAITRGTVSSEEKNTLTVVNSQLQETNTKINYSLGVVFSNNESLRPLLESAVRTFIQATEELSFQIILQVIRVETPTIDPSIFRQETERTLNASFSLWDQTSIQLDNVLNQRIGQAQNRRIFFISLITILVLVAVYLFLGFYRAVMDTVRAFQQAAGSMLSSNTLSNVAIDTRDELGQVATSFNSIASAMVESSSQRQAIVDHAAEAIITYDQQGIIRSANRAAERILGRNVDQLNIAEVLGVELANIQQQTTTYEFDVRLPTNEIQPVEMVLGTMQLGEQQLWIAFLRDIRIRRRTEQERNRLQDEIIRGHAAVLARLSAPLIPLSDNVVVMPLVGALDGERLQQITNNLLEGLSNQRARVALLDMTGVPNVDREVASRLLRAAQGIRLLGADLILTGIQPDVAQALISVGGDLSDLQTYPTLQQGIRMVLRNLA
ncbi:MAG TPA: PAS domain S-box protein [Herpetosiphon sp.]|uniref:PAS/PAC sensor protein n=1 Tax=Herpetosiphon aurantiacus (strain ATCC 23779 / DSM 785 / 114-95) TaxID=316274 RepID=A9B606_HERA2|nr:STAS domain-containing protein [Herpetosiphon sp.]ABX05799.1 putative PAS/PAC sensor protein [Herpetosiphon aurantiacus DSM 785]HBW49435.1 PAS domain S-box protein [Herpetosiphon sp.]